MATSKPKLQGYVEQDLFDRFSEWKAERGIEGDSAALTQLLKEFFGVPSPQVPVPPPDESDIRQIVELLLEEKLPSREEIRISIQEELWDSGKRDFIDGIKAHAENAIASKISQSQAYWESTAASGQEMKKAIAQIEDRITALESNPPSNPSSDTELMSEIADTLHNLEERLEALESRLLQSAKVPESPGDRLAAACISGAVDNSPKPSAQPDSEISPTEKQQKESRLPSDLPPSLSGTELAKRLRIDKSLVTKNRDKSTFETWTAFKDPRGIAWRYMADTKRYEPVRQPTTDH
jgi:hypothetical protein